jgi:hypothetical protein
MSEQPGYEELPSLPDNLGDPRPTGAPVHTWSTLSKGQGRFGSVPTAPEGFGPTLEFYRRSVRSIVLSVLILILLLAGLFTARNGTRWFDIWWVWVVFLGAAVVLLIVSKREVTAAGARWLRTEHGWIGIYELTEIALLETKRSHVLRLTKGESKLSVPLGRVTAQPEIWNLVYAGVVHSVASGAKFDASTYQTFQLARYRIPGVDLQRSLDLSQGVVVGTVKPRFRILSVFLWCLGGAVLVFSASGFFNLKNQSASDRGASIGGLVVFVVVGLIIIGFGSWLRRRGR